MKRLWLVLVALSALCVGCGLDVEGPCVPGESVACTGQSGCAGYQVCADEGDHFLPCVCDGDAVEDAFVEDILVEDVQEDTGTDEGPDTSMDASTDIPVEDVCGEEQERPCAGNTCKWGMSLACPEPTSLPTKPTEAEVLELLSCSPSSEVCARCGVNEQLPCGNAADGGVYCRSNAVQWYSPDLGVSLMDRTVLFSCSACGSEDQPCCVYKDSFHKTIYDQDLLPKAACQDGLICDQSSGMSNMRCVEAPAS
jgi:hypothetical protein